jgi:hypothetical protein
MTADDWLQRTLRAADQLALAYACTPDDRVEASLAKVADGVRKAWRKASRSCLLRTSTAWLRVWSTASGRGGGRSRPDQ